MSTIGHGGSRATIGRTARARNHAAWWLILCLGALTALSPQGSAQEIYTLEGSGPPTMSFDGAWVFVARMEADLDTTMLRRLSGDRYFRALASKQPWVHLVEEVWAAGNAKFSLALSTKGSVPSGRASGAAHLTENVVRVQTAFGREAWEARAAGRDASVRERAIIYDYSHPGVRAALESDGLYVTLPSNAIIGIEAGGAEPLFVLVRGAKASIGSRGAPPRPDSLSSVVRRVLPRGADELAMADIAPDQRTGPSTRVANAGPVRLTFRARYGGDWGEAGRGGAWVQVEDGLIVLESEPPRPRPR